MSKIVCYFSCSGVTKSMASIISDTIGADIFEIEPSIPYTSEDLDWTNKNSRSSIEMNDKSSRPSIKSDGDISTFIESNNFDGKNVYVFVTSGSSSVDSSFNNLKKEYPNINFISGKRFDSSVTKEDILYWLND